MKLFYLLIPIFFMILNFYSFAQSKIEADIETALVNARKGIYWGLNNIPVKKARLDKSLIYDDKLIAKVRISKELNGVKIESTGYNNTNEVTVVLYRSADSLVKDGYIKKGDLEVYSDDE